MRNIHGLFENTSGKDEAYRRRLRGLCNVRLEPILVMYWTKLLFVKVNTQQQAYVTKQIIRFNSQRMLLFRINSALLTMNAENGDDRTSTQFAIGVEPLRQSVNREVSIISSMYSVPSAHFMASGQYRRHSLVFTLGSADVTNQHTDQDLITASGHQETPPESSSGICFLPSACFHWRAPAYPAYPSHMDDARCNSRPIINQAHGHEMPRAFGPPSSGCSFRARGCPVVGGLVGEGEMTH